MYVFILWEDGHNMSVLNVPLIDPLEGERPEYSIYYVYSIITVYSIVNSDVIPEYSGCSELGLEHGQVHAYAVAAAQREGDEDLLEPTSYQYE